MTNIAANTVNAITATSIIKDSGSYYAVYYTKSNGDIFNLITQEESLCDGVIRLKVKDVW